MTSRLGTGNPLTFFLQCNRSVGFTWRLVPEDWRWSKDLLAGVLHVLILVYILILILRGRSLTLLHNIKLMDKREAFLNLSVFDYAALLVRVFFSNSGFCGFSLYIINLVRRQLYIL